MFRKLLCSSVALFALASAANAVTISFTSPVNQNLPYFDTYVGESGSWLSSIGSWFGDGIVYPAGYSVSGVTLAPTDGAAYMSVAGEEHLTLNTAATSFTIGWGSPDAYNGLMLGNFYLSGATVAAAFGNSGFGETLVTVSDLNPFTNVSFISRNPDQSKAAAFEFTGAGSATPTPEASTWVMMLAGFASLMFMGARKAKAARSIVS